MSNKTNSRPDVAGTLKKLQAKDPGLKRLLEKAHGYAVFPSVGKAGVVIGGGYGRGDVFEKGKLIGHAKITQLTIGVQLGGDTFSEIVVFETKEDLERFKRGKTAFAANASAVLVKAGAASAKNFSKGVAVYVWPEGGMLLELGLGGQRFTFKPADREQGEGKEEGDEERRGKGAQGRGQEEGDESGEGEDQEQGEEGEEESGAGAGGNRALELAGRAVGGVRHAASKATAMVKRHPVAATFAGVGLATGLGLLIARAMRSGADDQGDADQDVGGEEDEQDEGAQDSAEDSADDSADESDEDDDRAEDQSDEDEDEGEAQDEQDQGEDDESEEDDEESDEEESSNRGVLSRLLSRGKSRP